MKTTNKETPSLQHSSEGIMVRLNPPSIPPSNSIEERALQWFTLLLSDSFTPTDFAKYKAWFSADKAHRQAYQNLEAVWEMLGDFEESPEICTLLNGALSET